MTEERTQKYQDGDCRRNPNWKRETRKQRRIRTEAKLRYWTPDNYRKYCEEQRALAAARAAGHDHT